MRVIGRFGLSVTLGCWGVALWAALMGTNPVRTTAAGQIWWPGSLYAILAAALVLAALTGLPALSDILHRSTGPEAGVSLWALAGGLGLAALIYAAWDVPTAWLRGMAAMELFAIGMGGLLLAGVTAPPPPPTVKGGLPPAQNPGAAGEGETVTLTWTGAGTGYTPVEPYSIDVTVDEVRLEAQKVAPHDLIVARWQAYCTVTPEIQQIAQQLRAISRREEMDPLDEIRLALAMLAERPGADHDRPLYPLESLTGPSGQAARSILAVAVLTALGYRAALLRTGDRTALAVVATCPLPDLFLQVEGQPALYAEFTPAGLICGDAPAEARGLPWQVLPLRG